MADDLSLPGASAAPTESKRRSIKIPLIAAALMLGFLVIFWGRNGRRRGINDTEVDFLIFEKFTTVRMLVLVSVIIGILLDRFFTIWFRRRKDRKASAG